MGFHSVIESPDSVRRVMPPNNTCIIIMPTPVSSQIPTALPEFPEIELFIAAKIQFDFYAYHCAILC